MLWARTKIERAGGVRCGGEPWPSHSGFWVELLWSRRWGDGERAKMSLTGFWYVRSRDHSLPPLDDRLFHCYWPVNTMKLVV